MAVALTTRVMKADRRQIPYVVAGNGGYYNLSKMKVSVKGKKPTPGKHFEPDGQGNTLNLEQFNDTDFGFIRVTVSAASIEVDSLGVNLAAPGATPTIIDSFSLNLATHTVTTFSA